VLVKASIIKGDAFVTAGINPNEIERLVKKTLIAKGFPISDSIIPGDNMYFVDLFIYQYPADLPTITLTVRTMTGLHYLDREVVEIFLDRKTAYNEMISRLMDRFPHVIDTQVLYLPILENIFQKYRISLIGSATSSVARDFMNKHISSINWNENENPQFLIGNGFNSYMKRVANFSKFGNILRGKTITVKLKINNSACFEVVDIESPFELSKKQIANINSFIDSFPLWQVDQEIHNIELTFGLKRY
jgi:hypothetical protein